MNRGRITNIVSNDSGNFVRIQIEPGTDVVVNADDLGPDVRYHHTLIGRRVELQLGESSDQPVRCAESPIVVRVWG